MELSSKLIQRYSKYSVPQLLKKCQTVFNAFIRKRDSHLPCISCQKGRVEQAGHFLSQGHHSALRFNENNTNGQCVRCNHFLSGNLINYRAGLVKKIGEARVQSLEDYPKKAHKWGRIEIIFLLEKYKKYTNGIGNI